MRSIKNEMREINQRKYLHPPTWEQISEFVKELGVKDQQFEKFYGIHLKCLTQIKRGVKTLPRQFWHIIFEKIKPNYGVGSVPDFFPTKTKYKPPTDTIIQYKRKAKHIQPISQDNHNRLSDVK